MNEMVRKKHSILSFSSKTQFLFFPKLGGIGRNTHLIIFHSIIYTHSISFYFFSIPL